LKAVADALEGGIPMDPPKADPEVEKLAREAFGQG